MVPLPRRIVRQTQNLQQYKIQGVQIQYDVNARYFHVFLDGPQGSLYQGGKFQIDLYLTQQYPMVPPKIRFLTKIFHPNIDRIGRISLDILQDRWSPALGIKSVLLGIQSLLCNPNPNDPLDSTVGSLWVQNQRVAFETAKK